MNVVPAFSKFESAIKRYGIVFSILVLFLGLMGGAFTKVKSPKRLIALSDNLYFRMTALVMLAFTATKDVETSIISVICFLIIMYLLKTPEERKKGIV